jgi:pimeloyl-ACP methyl ester carboxylesterase
MSGANTNTTIEHGRVRLALHQISRGDGDGLEHHPLLVLHGLGEHSPPSPPLAVESWPGPIYGLDFTGHGDSTVPGGGGYTCEVLVGDADRALAHLGRCTVYGRGLGAYVALLLAGIRTEEVAGVILDDGPGLLGGGSESLPPGTSVPIEASANAIRMGQAPDPFALMELSRDVRPPDYAAIFARFALERSPLDLPITVSAVVRPPWLAAVAAEPGVAVSDVSTALARYSD